MSTSRNFVSLPLSAITNNTASREMAFIFPPITSTRIQRHVYDGSGRQSHRIFRSSLPRATKNTTTLPTDDCPLVEEASELNAGIPAEETQKKYWDQLWQSYNVLLREKPVLAKSLTSLFGFMLGDICAQVILGSPYDLLRTLRSTSFGVLMDGPIGHCWYLFLDKNIMPETPTVPKAIVAKTALDQLLWAPFFSCVFFTFNQLLQGHLELAIPTIQNTLVPTLTANYALWPLAHLVNFRFIPSEQRILYINVVQILWTSYLSNLAACSSSLKTVKKYLHHQQHHAIPSQLSKTMHHDPFIYHQHHVDIVHTIVSKLHMG